MIIDLLKHHYIVKIENIDIQKSIIEYLLNKQKE